MKKIVERALRVCALGCAVALAACGGGGGGGGSDPVPPPTFVTQPQSVTIGTGGTATFTVTAGGTEPLSYQWQRSNDAGATWSDIGGATARDFVVAEASLAWARSRLRVRVSNAAGTVNSEVVSLVVQPTVRAIAGKPGFWGYADGQGAAARFGVPQGIVADPAGNLLVADRLNGVIRRVTPQGNATTVAGRYHFGDSALTDGAAGVARFGFPMGLARAADGTLFVGDPHRLRRIAPDGTVSTLAGSDTQAVVDGAGAAASFGDIRAVALDPAGNILVAEGNPYNVIRRVTPAGVVTTLAGVPNNPGSVDGPGPTARFQDIYGMTVSAGGTMYVADGTAVRQVLADGTVSLYAGSPQAYGNADGPRLSARFVQLHSVAFDTLGNLWVGDSDSLRRIAPDGNVDTVAGGNLGVCEGRAMRDGTAAQACLYQPTSMAPLPDGSGMAFTSNQGAVRRVTHGGAVTTVAGDAWYLGSGVDGTGGNARFSSFEAMARDSAGNIWVPGGLSLRRITPAGVATTLQLDPMQGVFAHRGLAFDAADNFVVTYSNRVWRINPAGVATLIAGQAAAGSANGNGAAAGFNNPSGVAVAPNGSIYVADLSNSTVRLISPTGDVTTVAGVAGSCGFSDGPAGVGRLCYPLNLALDGAGRLYIVDGGAHTVRRLDPDGSLHTVAGSPFSRGFSEGPVSRFRDPAGIGVDSQGNVYVSDSGNGLIRRIDANGVVTVVMGQYGLQALRPGVDGALNKPGALLVLPNGRLVFGSEQVLVGD